MKTQEKPIRNAVRCILIENEKVVVTKYKGSNKKAGYYEIPGGKIEEGETPEEAAIREFKEETGMCVTNLRRRGTLVIEYPNRIFHFEVFITHDYKGKPMDFVENSAEWIEISEVLKKEKKLTSFILLDTFFKDTLQSESGTFSMYLVVSETEVIESVNYTWKT